MVEQRWPKGIRPARGRIQIRIRGKQEYTETIKGNIDNARDLARAVKRRDELASRRRIGLPLRKDDEPDSSLFSALAQDYMNLLEAERSTQITYKRILNRYWMPEFSSWIASEITTLDIKRVLKKHDVSSKTKRNILIPLRGIFDHGSINPNPATIKLKKHQKSRVQRYTPEERDHILDNLSGQPLVYFALLFGCGLRPGEALGLRWEDYSGDSFRIHQTMVMRRLKPTTKTHVERDVYVPPWVRTYLDGCETRFKNTYIFLNVKDEWFKDTDTVNHAWRAAHAAWNLKNRKSQIPYRDPYTCRHTRAAELLSTGVDAGDAAKQLGHSLQMFLQVYSEWIDAYSGKKDMSRFDGVNTKTGTKRAQNKEKN